MYTLQNKITLAMEVKPRLGVLQGSRVFTKGRHGRKIIFFPSVKNGKTLMPCEGELEAAHALWMEFDNSIAEYKLQPFEINTGTRRYTPDAMVIHTDGHISFRQVKPYSVLENDSVKSLLTDVENYFSCNGYRHDTLTEKDFLRMTEHRNREVIYAGLKLSVTHNQMEYAKHLLHQGVSGDFKELHKLLAKNNLPLQLLEHLIHEGYLTFDKHSILTAHTILEVA